MTGTISIDNISVINITINFAQCVISNCVTSPQKSFLCQYVLHAVNLTKKRKISNRTKFRHWKSCMKNARTALNKLQPRNIFLKSYIVSQT